MEERTKSSAVWKLDDRLRRRGHRNSAGQRYGEQSLGIYSHKISYGTCAFAQARLSRRQASRLALIIENAGLELDGGVWIVAHSRQFRPLPVRDARSCALKRFQRRSKQSIRCWRASTIGDASSSGLAFSRVFGAQPELHSTLRDPRREGCS